MPKSLIEILPIIASAQGVFLAIFIFHKHARPYANRFLGCLILFYSLIVFETYLGDSNFYMNFPKVRLFTLPTAFLIAPLLYLYTKYLTSSIDAMREKDRLHFLSYLVYQIVIFPFIFKSSPTLAAQFVQMDQGELPWQFSIMYPAILIQALVYLIISLVVLMRYAQRLISVFSSLDHINLAWLRNIIMLLATVVLFFSVEYILGLFGIHLSKNFQLTSLLAAAGVYILGYLVLLKSDEFKKPIVSATLRQMPEVAAEQIQHSRSASKYAKSGLSEETAKAYLSELLSLMDEEKPHRDSELTLAQLGAKLGITPHNLSQVFNSQLGQSFFDFINKYRVNDVKEAFVDPHKQNLKILAIAFDAGFNSKTAFNTIFKKITGKTPSQYRQEIQF
jgi:AraC-like DNA-binding protein